MAISEKQAKGGEEDTPTSNDALLAGSRDDGAKGKKKKKGVTLTKKGDVIATVTMLDGHDLQIELPKTALGQELLDKVCEKLQLLEKDWFSCSYRVNNVKYWLNHERRISKQLNNEAWDFLFQVKFYPSEPTIMSEDLTRYQLFLQVRTDVYTGKLPCSFVTYSLLGSYAAQSEFGDFDAAEGSGIQYLKDSAPYAPQQPDELLERIAELHRTHVNMNPADAEMAYLDNAKVLALYGVDLHQAKDEGFSDVMVGVCSYGLNIFKDKLRVHRFPWAKILKIAYKRNCFYVKNRPSENSKSAPATLTYKLANHKMAKRLWKTAVEHHAFFRLKEPEPPRKGMFPLFGSKFRYSGRTQHQTRDAFHNLDRKTPTIDRAASRRYAAGGGHRAYEQSGGAGVTYSTDRVEEVIMPSEQHTATLDIKMVRKNRSMNTPTEEVDRSFNQEGTMKMGEDYSNVSYTKGSKQGLNSSSNGFNTSGRYDQYGNVISNGVEGPYGNNTTDDGSGYQDDHLKNTSLSAAGAGHFGGRGFQNTNVTSKSRTYTNADGTVVTERQHTTETKIAHHHVTSTDDFDHDQALHDAIFAVTDMNQDLSVQKIEIQAEK